MKVSRVYWFVPNVLDYARALLLLLGSVALDPLAPAAGPLALLALSAALDLVDGALARRLHQCSRLGAYLDVLIDNAWCAAGRCGPPRRASPRPAPQASSVVDRSRARQLAARASACQPSAPSHCPISFFFFFFFFRFELESPNKFLIVRDCGAVAPGRGRQRAGIQGLWRRARARTARPAALAR